MEPAPPVQVVFEEIRGMTVSRISVARAEKPLYTLDNVVYLRRRSSNVQVQPDQIVSLVTQFAF
jgi:predicted HTH transcriptional regulator